MARAAPGVPDEEAATGATTVTAVLERLAAEGFGAPLAPADEPGRLHCAACGTTSDAAAFEVVHERRLEGASDPDDMVLVVAARCPACGRGGTVVLGYGATASEADADVVVALSRPT